MKLKRRERKRLYWRQEETQYFLSLCLRRNVIGQLGVLKRGNAFEQLANDMRNAGFEKSGRQCRTKLKHLKCDFLRMGSDMPFANEMDRLLRKHRELKNGMSSSEEHTHNGLDCCELSNYNTFNVVNIKTEVEDSDASATYDNEFTETNAVEINEYTPYSQDAHIKTENDNDTSERSILQINSVTSLRDEHHVSHEHHENNDFQHNELLNNLIKNQKTFINDILETQKKWNAEIVEKLCEHQQDQLKIIMESIALKNVRTSSTSVSD